MQRSSKRFDALRTVFEQYSTCLTEAAAHPDCPVKGWGVETHVEQNYVDILFVGFRWRFLFSAVADDNEITSARVTLYKVAAFPEAGAVEVCSFSFKATGDSDVVPPDNDGDPVPMNTNGGAMCLAMHCIHQGLAAKP